MPASDPAEPVHLRPTAPIAQDALLPGDPGRALALAQSLLTKPLMANHARGLWGYYGTTAEGNDLTIQATGMGGPSAAIVLSELAALGTRRAIRVGTCGALDPALGLGELIAVSDAVAADGTSARLGADGLARPDRPLTAALEAAGATARRIVSTDLFYELDASERARGWAEQGAAAVEMEAATLFALGSRIGVAVACLLVVSDTFEGGIPGRGRRRIADEDLAAVAERMGRVAASALAVTR